MRADGLHRPAVSSQSQSRTETAPLSQTLQFQPRQKLKLVCLRKEQRRLLLESRPSGPVDGRLMGLDLNGSTGRRSSTQ